MKTQKPAYLTLYEALREEIMTGIRPRGSRLPSRRSLARDRGLSEITVDHGLELLIEEGYAEARPRSGVYVTYRAGEGFSGPAQPRRVFPAAVPRPENRDTFPFPTLAKVMRRVISDYGEALLVKPPNAGCEALREALSAYLARNRGIRAGTDSGPHRREAGTAWWWKCWGGTGSGDWNPPPMKKSSGCTARGECSAISCPWGRTEL